VTRINVFIISVYQKVGKFCVTVRISFSVGAVLDNSSTTCKGRAKTNKPFFTALPSWKSFECKVYYIKSFILHVANESSSSQNLRLLVNAKKVFGIKTYLLFTSDLPRLLHTGAMNILNN
jgi:hypothetical protein